MWAKFKPVRRWHTSNQADTYKADDGLCGLDLTNALISDTSDLSNIATKYNTNDEKNGWEYAKPRGVGVGITEWFRLRDFDGYIHNAPPFVRGFSTNTIWSKTKDSALITYMAVIEGDAYLSIKDLAINDYYSGVALIEKGTTNVLRQTNSDTLGNIGFDMSFPLKDLPIGDYIVYPFICSRELTMATANTVLATVYTIPNCSPLEVKVVTSDLRIILSAMYSKKDDGMYDLEYSITINTVTGATKTLNNNKLILKYAHNSFDAPVTVGEIIKTLETITVSTTPITIQGSIGSVQANLQANSNLWISLNNGQYIEDTMPMVSAGPK